MIKPELGSQGKWLSSAQSLGGRQKNLFFHANMPKESCTELGIGVVIDRARVSHSRLQQPIKPPVVVDKKSREHTRLPFLWLYYQPTPTMDSPQHNIDLASEPPAVSLGRMVCLDYLVILVCLIFPTLCENHLSPGMPSSATRSCPEPS